MFDSIRKHQRILLFVLVVLIFPAFAFFGIQGYDRFLSDGDSVAKVGGQSITRQEFDNAQRERIDRIRQMLGEGVDMRMFDTPAMRSEILEGLIVQRALAANADKQKIIVTDARLREAIRAIPGLTRPDGSFDLERYKGLVNAQGRSEAAFEFEFRRDLAVQAMPDSLSSSVVLPTQLVDRIAQLVEQTREVRELKFSPKDQVAAIKPDEQTLKRFYQDNPTRFQTPESVSVEFLVLDLEAVAKGVQPSEDEVRSFFEQNRRQYATQEERQASHVLIKLTPDADTGARAQARAKAESLLQQLQRGADFAAIAREHSQDPGSAREGGDLGFFSRDMMVKPFADAVFGMKDGELSGLVESEFGYHIIKLTGVRPARERSLVEVRADIERQIRQQLASRRYAEDAEAFGNLVYEQPESLQAAADRFKLSLQTEKNLLRLGATALPREHPLNQPAVLSALFSPDAISSRRNIEAIDLGGSRMISARVLEHKPAASRAFEAVEAEIREAVIREQALQRAVDAGRERFKALKSGGSTDGLSEPRSVIRSAKEPALPPAALEAVFRAPETPLPAWVGVDLGDDGFAIYQVTKVTTPDVTSLAERRDGIRQQLERIMSQQELLDYVETVKARTEISRRSQRSATGQDNN
jgi:peptidyl-prolyl cis-trans isomerase D